MEVCICGEEVREVARIINQVQLDKCSIETSDFANSSRLHAGFGGLTARRRSRYLCRKGTTIPRNRIRTVWYQLFLNLIALNDHERIGPLANINSVLDSVGSQ
jgi:hypothetical protein